MQLQVYALTRNAFYFLALLPVCQNADTIGEYGAAIQTERWKTWLRIKERHEKKGLRPGHYHEDAMIWHLPIT